MLAVFITVLQIADLTPAIQSRRKIYVYQNGEKQYEYKMKSEIWDELAETRDCVYVITAKMPLEDYDYKISMNLWVYLNGLKISSTYIAHQSETLQEHSLEIYQDIKQGNLDENALYWFESEEYMLQAEKWMHCEVIDGYYLGWVT